MKDSYENDTLAQKEALINEFKGNLFEFLVAKELATNFNIYNQFIAAFVQAQARQQKFQQYESWLRKYSPEVLVELPKLAKILSDALSDYIRNDLKIELKRIQLVGKLFDQKQDYSNEADLLLYDKNKVTYPLSLKLCKKGSFVNTKSAGVSSFIEKYFTEFKSSKFHQDELNLILDQSYLEMGEKLYEQFDMIFTGKFGNEWTDKGNSELPGQLDPVSRSIVHQSYNPIIKKIYLSILAFEKENPELLKTCLSSILGYSKENMIQALCFHNGTDDYSFDHVTIDSSQKIWEELTDYELIPFTDLKASFEIQLSNSVLQIRVKPMNKFTAKSHKINCSYKRRNVS
ncbi:MAG: hypothetical protein HN576_06730 [Bacteriovoracaceae bacterium]|jgi:hypothetical protein|nr:hypothetical protein [Bacteriovoracaceae bacterium]